MYHAVGAAMYQMMLHDYWREVTTEGMTGPDRFASTPQR
jgi:hypothetical protein